VTTTFILSVNGHKIFDCGESCSLWRRDTGAWVSGLTRDEAIELAQQLPVVPSRDVEHPTCTYCLDENIHCPICEPD
jgi:hypothetical protein